MPHNLPTKYQPNRRRLWIPWWQVPEALQPKLEKYKAFSQYGCYLPNTRRFRKLLRGILRDWYQGIGIPAYGTYDLCFDPGAGYIYSNYGGVMENACPTGRLYPSRPNWQWWPRPPGGLRHAEIAAKFAQGAMAEQWAGVAGDIHSLVGSLFRPDKTADGSGEIGQKFPVDNSESQE